MAASATPVGAKDNREKLLERAMSRYQYSGDALIEVLHLLIATGQNNLAMNHAVEQTARQFVSARTIQEGMLNRIEAAIRCFDPCLSCATHADGTIGGSNCSMLQEICWTRWRTRSARLKERGRRSW